MTEKMMIPLSRPDITEHDIEAVVNVLKTPYLSLGPKLQEFETKFAEYVGSKYAVAVNSGTSGLHLAVKSLGIGEGDAAITSPFSFVASANCLLYERAIPLFVDIDPKTFNIDPIRIEEFLKNECCRDKKTGVLINRKTGRRVRAILPVHVFGVPCDMAAIMSLAEEYQLHVIEDACEALGAEFRGRKVGNFGIVSVFAFYPNKQMTTGEGGMIVTNDLEISDRCKSLRNQGRGGNGKWLNHVRLGYNYRISDINCALGIAQLERIDGILKKRQQVAATYNELLRDLFIVPQTLNDTKTSWFVYVVRLQDTYSQDDRDTLVAELLQRGIGCNNYFPPIHLQPLYQEMFGYEKGDFEITENISARTLALPFYNHLEKEGMTYIANKLKEILRARILKKKSVTGKEFTY